MSTIRFVDPIVWYKSIEIVSLARQQAKHFQAMAPNKPSIPRMMPFSSFGIQFTLLIVGFFHYTEAIDQILEIATLKPAKLGRKVNNAHRCDTRKMLFAARA